MLSTNRLRKASDLGRYPRPVRTALLVDYFGVLTTSLDDVVRAWIAADNLDPEKCAAYFSKLAHRSSFEVDGPIHGLEIGTWTPADFEVAVAAEMVAEGLLVEPAGLLDRMFGGFRVVPEMIELVAKVRTAGVRTALVTNSFGISYPREDWPRLFDVTVVSHEVGLRKPDPAIYELALQRLGAAADTVVFVDDMQPNIDAAAAMGMATVLHVDHATTATALTELLDLDL
jgi:putative hydrolase of the HAD superfamily